MGQAAGRQPARHPAIRLGRETGHADHAHAVPARHRRPGGAPHHERRTVRGRPESAARPEAAGENRRRLARSEEHTSELQSLMRISYAVFCLKKKKHIIKTSRYTNNNIT